MFAEQYTGWSMERVDSARVTRKADKSPKVATKEYHKLNGLNNRNVLTPSSGG